MNNSNQNRNSAGSYAGQVSVARTDTLMIFIFTIVNIGLLFLDGVYFLFSAVLPYFVAVIPFSVKWAALDDPTATLPGTGMFVFFIAVAVILALPYLLAFIFSKKHPRAWLIVSLVCICIDSAAMLLLYIPDFQGSNIIDIAFHAWMIITVAKGISGASKLEKVQEQIAQNSEEPEYVSGADTENAPAADSMPAMRAAGTEEKIKVYLETDAYGHRITYRRYGKIEELVIDGMVYAECGPKGLKTGHEMSAKFEGHVYTAGMFNQNYINVDGINLKTSTRWW